TVVGRHFAPFSFGRATGSAERWIRTCPVTQEPGRFTTHRGWIDPFRLLNEEDPSQPYRIASILSQEGVEAVWSGALICSENDEALIEGVSGSGDEFMLGKRGPQALPAAVREAVLALLRRARQQLGSVRMEWVFDGKDVWVVQMHKGSVASTA